MQTSKKSLKTAAISLAILAVSLATAYVLMGEKTDLKRNRAVIAAHTVKIPKSINWVPARLASQEALKALKPIFCVFTAENNKLCRELEAKVLSDDKFSDYVNQNFIPVFIVYLDSLPANAQEKIVSRTYGVSTFPCLLITDPNGNKLAQKLGAVSKADAFKFLAASRKTTGKQAGALPKKPPPGKKKTGK